MRRHAFTLIELLVTLAVIGLLLSLLVPSLANARRNAQRTKSQSNARSIAQLMAMYNSIDQDRYPAAIEGRFYPTSEPNIQITLSWWQVCWNWPGLLTPVAGWEELREISLSPGARPVPGSPVQASYEYSNSFVGDPSIWSGVATPTRSLLTARHASDVHHPSAKVLVFDRRLAFLRRPITLYGNDLLEHSPAAFADGHTDNIVPAYASVPVFNPFPEASLRKQRLHNTRLGVYGRDY